MSSQLVLGPNKKSRKAGLVNDVDLITNLPDCLISRILSLLPTKDAVRTSVLSKDWEYKWTSIYNIHIVNRCFDSEKGRIFANFVERVLLHAVNIKSFHLDFFGMYDTSRLASWISAALRRNIESLEFSYLFDDFAVLPRSLINNSSLRKINIFNSCFKVPPNNSFPNLTTLRLGDVRIQNECLNTDHLTFTFPVLKTLDFVYCKWLKVKSVEIHAPELIEFNSATAAKCAAEADYYSIKVTGNKLKKLECFGHLPDDVVVTGSQVLDASLKYIGKTDGFEALYAKKGQQVRMLLQGFSSLMRLELTSSMVEAMWKGRLQFPLPIFLKLTQLLLYTPVYCKGLLYLLQAMPYLKLLSMEVHEDVLWDTYDYDAVESLPSCVASHLEEVLFSYFTTKYPRCNLAKYLLKNGKQLKKFNVFHCGSTLVSKRILEKLSACPKISTNLTIGTPSFGERSTIVWNWGHPC